MTYGDGHALSVDYDLNYRATRLLRAKNGLSLMDLGRPCRGLFRLYPVPRTEYFCSRKTVSKAYDPASDITAINDNVRADPCVNLVVER